MFRITSVRLGSCNSSVVKAPTVQRKFRYLTAAEKAFIAGACIVGNLTPDKIIPHLSIPLSRVSVYVNCQKMKARAAELSCPLGDPRCFETRSFRAGKNRLITETLRKQVIDLLVSDKQYRKMTCRGLADQIEAIGLPRISASAVQRLLHDADYVWAREGWKLKYTRKPGENQRERIVTLLASAQHRRKSAEQIVADGELRAAGLPRYNPLVLENTMYRAGYVQGPRGWELRYTPEGSTP